MAKNFPPYHLGGLKFMFKFSAVELNTQYPRAAVPGRHVPSSTLKENGGTNTTPVWLHLSYV